MGLVIRSNYRSNYRSSGYWRRCNRGQVVISGRPQRKSKPEWKACDWSLASSFSKHNNNNNTCVSSKAAVWFLHVIPATLVKSYQSKSIKNKEPQKKKMKSLQVRDWQVVKNNISNLKRTCLKDSWLQIALNGIVGICDHTSIILTRLVPVCVFLITAFKSWHSSTLNLLVWGPVFLFPNNGLDK